MEEVDLFGDFAAAPTDVSTGQMIDSSSRDAGSTELDDYHRQASTISNDSALAFARPPSEDVEEQSPSQNETLNHQESINLLDFGADQPTSTPEASTPANLLEISADETLKISTQVNSFDDNTAAPTVDLFGAPAAPSTGSQDVNLLDVQPDSTDLATNESTVDIFGDAITFPLATFPVTDTLTQLQQQVLDPFSGATQSSALLQPDPFVPVPAQMNGSKENGFDALKVLKQNDSDTSQKNSTALAFEAEVQQPDARTDVKTSDMLNGKIQWVEDKNKTTEELPSGSSNDNNEAKSDEITAEEADEPTADQETKEATENAEENNKEADEPSGSQETNAVAENAEERSRQIGGQAEAITIDERSLSSKLSETRHIGVAEGELAVKPGAEHGTEEDGPVNATEEHKALGKERASNPSESVDLVEVADTTPVPDNNVAVGDKDGDSSIPREALESEGTTKKEMTLQVTEKAPTPPTIVSLPPPAGRASKSSEMVPHTSAEIPDIKGNAPDLNGSTAEARSNEKSLRERIEELERDLRSSQALILQLNERHAKNENDAQVQDSLLVDLQTNLQKQMNERAESEDKARRAMGAAKAMKEKFDKLSVESREKIKQLEEEVATAISTQASLESEMNRAKHAEDESTKKEASMALRLNEIIKTQAEGKNAAKYYEDQVEKLSVDLQTTKDLLASTSAERDRMKAEASQWKNYAESRSKQLEKAVTREKKLNEDRKRKMKEFVEAKTEEVRAAKADSISLQTEMDQTNMTLKDLNQRYKQLHTQWVESQTRNRELQRDITKMKKDSEKMSKVGGTLEAKLSRSAQESEDHKNKRLAAKNELMAVLRQLEAERNVNQKTREKLKDSLTPKILNQQQAIQGLIDSIEDIMQKVSIKLGRQIPPPTRNEASMDAMADEGNASINPDSAAAVSEANMQRSMKKIENEMKRVSQYIQAATNTTGRLKALVEAPSTRGCVDAFSSFLMTAQVEGTGVPDR